MTISAFYDSMVCCAHLKRGQETDLPRSILPIGRAIPAFLPWRLKMEILGHGHSPLNILRTVLEIPLTDEVTRFYPMDSSEIHKEEVLKSHAEFSTMFGQMTPEGEDQDEFEDVMIGQNNPWIMFSPVTLPPSKMFYMEEIFDDGEEEDLDLINELFQEYGLTN